MNYNVYILCEWITFLYIIRGGGNSSTQKFNLRFAYRGGEDLQIYR